MRLYRQHAKFSDDLRGQRRALTERIADLRSEQNEAIRTLQRGGEVPQKTQMVVARERGSDSATDPIEVLEPATALAYQARIEILDEEIDELQSRQEELDATGTDHARLMEKLDAAMRALFGRDWRVVVEV